MNNKKTLTVGIAGVVVLLVVLLGHWGSDDHGSAERLEKELRLCRMERALLTPLLAQPCRRISAPHLPVSFLLDEAECASKLLSHLRISNVHISLRRRENSSDSSRNASAINVSRTPAQPSP